MFIEGVQRSADVICSRDAPCRKAKSEDITDVKVEKSLVGTTGQRVNFVLEIVNKK
jgi:hypothetical protein